MYSNKKQICWKQLNDPERGKKKYWKKMTLLRKALNDLDQMEDPSLDDVQHVNNLWMLTRRWTHIRPSERAQISLLIQQSKEELKNTSTQHLEQK